MNARPAASFVTAALTLAAAAAAQGTNVLITFS
jgi:hypothetical protein